jgi:hypothetical protein
MTLGKAERQLGDNKMTRTHPAQIVPVPVRWADSTFNGKPLSNLRRAERQIDQRSANFLVTGATSWKNP